MILCYLAPGRHDCESETPPLKEVIETIALAGRGQRLIRLPEIIMRIVEASLNSLSDEENRNDDADGYRGFRWNAKTRSAHRQDLFLSFEDIDWEAYRAVVDEYLREHQP